jgi:signal peptidase I
MSIEFIILNIALLILSYVVIRYKEYKKSLAVFLIMVLTIFYSPTIYYILGGTAYKTFDDGDLKLYMLLGSTTFIFYALMICIKNNTKQIRLPKIKRKKAKSIAMIYIFAVSLIVFLYIALFLNRFPLIQAL